MFACSIKSDDLAFARQLAEQHPREVTQFFDPNLKKININALAAVIATFASNNADIDAYTAENFLPYLKSLLEMEVSQKDFDYFQEMYDTLKDKLSIFVYTENTDREEGTRKLAEEEAKDLYVTFKDSDGNIYALLRPAPALEYSISCLTVSKPPRAVPFPYKPLNAYITHLYSRPYLQLSYL